MDWPTSALALSISIVMADEHFRLFRIGNYQNRGSSGIDSIADAPALALKS